MKLLFKALLFLAITTTYAQNTLTGTVKDKTINEPVAFANVYFPQLEKGTDTDENGLFKMCFQCFLAENNSYFFLFWTIMTKGVISLKD